MNVDTSEVAIFDARNNLWSETQLSVSRADGHALSVGDLAFFFDNTDDTIDVYNVATRVRSVIHLPGYARVTPSAAAVDGLIVFDTGDIYNAASGLWSKTLSLIDMGFVGQTATTVGHLAIFAGGGNFNHSGPPGPALTDVVNIYDATTGQWSTTHVPQPAAESVVASVGNLALFARDQVNSQSGFSDAVDIYNASTGKWTVGHLSSARSLLAATAVGNFALFGGGFDGDAPFGKDSSNVVDVYDAASDQWFKTKLSSPREFLTATTAAGKALFAAGIYGVQDALDIFTPVPGLVAKFRGKLGGTVTVTIQSTGDADPPAGTTLSLYAATGATLDNSGVLLGQATLKHRLVPGGSATLHIAASLPSTLAMDRYHLVATLDDGDGQGPLEIAVQGKTLVGKGRRNGSGVGGRLSR